MEPSHSDATVPAGNWRCRILGHRILFRADGPQMVWECQRGCGVLGSKIYNSSAEATRFATAFDRRDSDDLGRRAPLIGLWPLRLWRRLRGGSPTTRR